MNSLEARRVLGVSVTSTPEEIAKVYRKRVYDIHPDRNPGDPRATDKVVRLTEAYSTLKRYAQCPAVPATGPAWDWFNADDAVPAGDPVAELVDDLRRTIREMDPAAADLAVAAALGLLAALMHYRR